MFPLTEQLTELRQLLVNSDIVFLVVTLDQVEFPVYEVHLGLSRCIVVLHALGSSFGRPQMHSPSLHYRGMLPYLTKKWRVLVRINEGHVECLLFCCLGRFPNFLSTPCQFWLYRIGYQTVKKCKNYYPMSVFVFRRTYVLGKQVWNDTIMTENYQNWQYTSIHNLPLSIHNISINKISWE